MKGIFFDVYGTLIDIETDESLEEIYRAIAHYLTYEGVHLHRFEVRELYFQIKQENLRASLEEYPEFDEIGIWAEFLGRVQKGVLAQTRLPLFLACLHRAVARKRLRPIHNVVKVLDTLRQSFVLAIVSDAQSVYVRSEMDALGLLGFFDHLVISSEHGFRKPDRRLFENALQKASLRPDEVLFVGNDPFRDIFGGKRAGMKTVLLRANRETVEQKDSGADLVINDLAELLTVS